MKKANNEYDFHVEKDSKSDVNTGNIFNQSEVIITSQSENDILTAYQFKTTDVDKKYNFYSNVHTKSTLEDCKGMPMIPNRYNVV